MGQYFRGLLLVVLNVPLAFLLAVLVYLGAFLPYVGAIVTGLVAALIALAERGPATALAVLGVVLVVQQLEGNVIQPVVACVARILDHLTGQPA